MSACGCEGGGGLAADAAALWVEWCQWGWVWGLGQVTLL